MRYRLYREFTSPSGIGLECAGLTLSAPDADEAVRRAKALFAHLAGVRKLVAIEETN